MTEPYYVYVHVDPETNKILYVGMGKGSRAYATKTTTAGKNEYGHRSPEHSDHLDSLLDLGYLPHEWVIFKGRNLSKTLAQNLEKELIKELKPIYNRKFGLKLCRLNKDQVILVLKQKQSGLTQRQIAKNFDVSEMVISRVCNSKNKNYKEMLEIENN